MTVFAPITDPTARVTSGPNGGYTGTRATFTFSSTVPNARYECTLDGDVSPCTSPFTASYLPGGRHTLAVGVAYATSGQAKRTFTADVTSPTASVAAFTPSVVRSASAKAKWSYRESGSGFATFQVRQRHAGHGGLMSA